jgi:hypothetical protein
MEDTLTATDAQIETHANDEPVSPLGHRLMFALLSLMALVLYAPTVLLPLVREFGELRAEERRLGLAVASLESEVARREELLDAFQYDSEINERLALLDLHYRRPHEEIVSLPAAGRVEPQVDVTQSADEAGGLMLPPNWPDWALSAEAWMDAKGLTGLFLDGGLRIVFLLMAGGLVIAAFVLFAPGTGETPLPLQKQARPAGSS